MRLVLDFACSCNLQDMEQPFDAGTAAGFALMPTHHIFNIFLKYLIHASP